MKIIFASTNEGKVKQIKEILKDYEVEILSLKDMNFNPQVVEDGDTYEENAYKKAKEVADNFNEIVIGDDSGLEVDALDGAPGLKTARFGGDHDWSNGMDKVLDLLKDVEDKDRTGKFVSCMVAILPNGEVKKTIGEWYGFIAHERKGTNSFGYAPIFLDPIFNLTSAEMEEEDIIKVNHRAKALHKMMKELNINKKQ